MVVMVSTKPSSLFVSCCPSSKKLLNYNSNSNTKKDKISKTFTFFTNDNLHPRNLAPCLFLCLYSIIGATIYFAIERSGSCPSNYWSSLFFVSTIYTSIGYGTVHPCTAGGKCFVIFYGFFGIPLTLLVLDNLGRMLATYANFMWIGSSSKCNSIKTCIWKKRSKVIDEQNNADPKITENDDVLQGLPIWIGILITVLWILISATCFFELEKERHFGDAMYFMFISVTTVGFGDIVPKEYQYVVFYQFLLIISLSLFSMCINIVQLRLDLLTETLMATIAKEYKESLFSKNEYGTMINTVKDHVDDLISKQPNGRYLKYLLGKKARQILITLIEKRINMKSEYCQTEIVTKDVRVHTHNWTSRFSVRTQTNVSAGKWGWLNK